MLREFRLLTNVYSGRVLANNTYTWQHAWKTRDTISQGFSRRTALTSVSPYYTEAMTAEVIDSRYCFEADGAE
jgi:hypothetical protein